MHAESAVFDCAIPDRAVDPDVDVAGAFRDAEHLPDGFPLTVRRDVLQPIHAG